MSRPRPTPPKSRTLWLTPDQEQRARAALLGGMTRDTTASLIGVPVRQLVYRLRDQLSDVRVGQGRWAGGKRVDTDPTPEEIAQRSAELRALWSDERRAEAWVGDPQNFYEDLGQG